MIESRYENPITKDSESALHSELTDGNAGGYRESCQLHSWEFTLFHRFRSFSRGRRNEPVQRNVGSFSFL